MMACKRCAEVAIVIKKKKLKLLDRWDERRKRKLYETVIAGYLVKYPFLGIFYGDLKVITGLGEHGRELEFLRCMKDDKARKEIFRDYGKAKKFRYMEGWG